MKKSLLILVLCLPILIFAASLTVEIDFSEGSRSGFSTAPGSKQVPVHSVNILLPKNAEILDYELSFVGVRAAAKSYTQVNPPFISEEGILGSSSPRSSGRRYNYLGLRHWGELRYASFAVKPYDESSGLWSETAEITIQYHPGTRQQGLIPATFKNADFFANSERLNQWYRSSKRHSMGIIVISTPELYNALSVWTAFRQGQGFSVQFSNIAEVLVNEVGANNADKLRNHLIAQQVLYPFSYVLLVGDHDLVPIAQLTPEPNSNTTVPSDFYYADLSSNWDTDGDGRYGEYYSEYGEEDYGVDYTPEAFVGRFSTNSAAEVSQIAQRIVAFEQSTAPFKNKALLPAAFLNYHDEPVPGMPQTDGAGLMELAKATILRNWQTTTLYEQIGVVPSYPSDFDLSDTNFNNLLRTEDFGLISWNAHGSAVSSARKIWMNDLNNNGFPEYYEMQWQPLVDTDSFDNIQTEYGSVIYAASCNNGYLDYQQQSLAEKALVTKAVAVVAASRTGWYKVGWENPGWGGLSSYNYHFIENYAEGVYSAGAALAYANLLHTQYYLFGDPIDDGGIVWPELQNVYTYLLFGDPVLGHSEFLQPEGEILVYSPHFDAYPVVNAIRENADINVIYSDRLIPDYDYLDSFKAVFCLFDDDIPAVGSFEYALLNGYLETGGKIYLEGRLPWDPNDEFMGKFGLEAPFDMVVHIDRIRAEDSFWDYANPDFQTDALLPLGDSASALFETANIDFADAIIGVLNSPEDYTTIGSSFRLTEVANGEPGLTEMVGLILEKLEVTQPVANSDELIVPAPIQLTAYPNPMRGALNISLAQTKKAEETVKIYNLKGQLITSLKLSAKNGYAMTWNGKDSSGLQCPNGIYILHSGAKSKKISLVK
ncbi:MAG: C25 family cysteine peptidase [Candidatus Cloacimonetes bacterium]|nr:C25 family cysteine peptidase [Candidatus Cloacimonadota bacterium]